MLKWLKRALWALLVCLLLASACGFVYQTVATNRDLALYHPRGQMVEIGGGRRLNLECQGSGSPTVILESGLGVPSSAWAEVVKGVEPLTRVCTYDRAGYGFSDAGPLPRTTNAITGDLEKMLAAAGEKGPYLLAGHSFGGFTIRVFAARHPAEVAGLIFVDASHPDQLQRMPASIRRKQMAVNWASQALPLLARVGAVRLALGPSGEASFLESQPKYAAALLSELDAFPESSAETKAAATSFGDLPIIVLTAGVDATGDPAMYTLWRNELQPELARLSTRGHQIIVEGATHMIMTRRPQAIVDAVREMLGTLKK